MSGTAAVANTFANAVTATGAQLDANFGTVVQYINDPTNRNNFATDGAATNTVALTFAPPVAGGYTTGLELTWKWGTTNTGAVVLNANGLGNANLVNPDGTALSSGQGVQGSIGKAVYDGTRFVYLTSFGTPASAAQMSAAASLVAFVSPGRVVNHPFVAKAWVFFNGQTTGTQTITANGVNTVARTATGAYAITFTTPFASTAYAGIVSANSGGVGNGTSGGLVPNRGAGTCTVVVSSGGANASVDSDLVCAWFFGPQ